MERGKGLRFKRWSGEGKVCVVDLYDTFLLDTLVSCLFVVGRRIPPLCLNEKGV